MNTYNDNTTQLRRQRKAIWWLSLSLAAMTFCYFMQVRETARSDRRAWELQESCDRLHNSLGMANYELGVLTEEK